MIKVDPQILVYATRYAIASRYASVEVTDALIEHQHVFPRFVRDVLQIDIDDAIRTGRIRDKDALRRWHAVLDEMRETNSKQ